MGITPYNKKANFSTNSAIPKIILYVNSFFFILFITAAVILEIKIGTSNYLPIGISVIIIAIGMIVFVSLSLYRRIFIDENGVKTVTKLKPPNISLKWEDIKVIGIGVYPYGTRPVNKYLYITTKDLEEDLAFDKMIYNPDVIITQFKPEIAHCIMNYWNGEIKNLKQKKSWQKYVDNL